MNEKNIYIYILTKTQFHCEKSFQIINKMKNISSKSSLFYKIEVEIKLL